MLRGSLPVATPGGPALVRNLRGGLNGQLVPELIADLFREARNLVELVNRLEAEALQGLQDQPGNGERRRGRERAEVVVRVDFPVRNVRTPSAQVERLADHFVEVYRSGSIHVYKRRTTSADLVEKRGQHLYLGGQRFNAVGVDSYDLLEQPQRVIDAWLGHRSDRSMAAVYYRLRDEDSQSFMGKVPFGTGEPAADAGKEAG